MPGRGCSEGPYVAAGVGCQQKLGSALQPGGESPSGRAVARTLPTLFSQPSSGPSSPLGPLRGQTWGSLWVRKNKGKKNHAVTLRGWMITFSLENYQRTDCLMQIICKSHSGWSSPSTTQSSCSTFPGWVWWGRRRRSHMEIRMSGEYCQELDGMR